MKLLLTGACGFVGSTIARALLAQRPGFQIIGVDNFSRPGSETNRESLKQLGVRLLHADLRNPSDLEPLPAVDWVLDAAANPSVLAGVDGQASSRQVVEHNLISTVNLLEYAREHGAGFLLLSTSRLYSIKELAGLPLRSAGERFELVPHAALPKGVSKEGIAESFNVTPPLSLYGATKLASEVIALEYAETFSVPTWINRCGVLAGPGQFGRADQGIIAFWLNSYLRRQPLRYVGFNGTGHQVRDALHPRDIATLVVKQLDTSEAGPRPRVVNLGGGEENSFSLAELSKWCAERFGFHHEIPAESQPRPLDLPWIVIDSTLAQETWEWKPTISLPEILEEVARHAEEHPEWLALSASLS